MVQNLTYLYTTDFRLKDYRSQPNGFINVNGYASNDYPDGLRIPVKDVECIKYSYPTNFMLNHMTQIMYGMKTNGSSNV
jgi:hypothetical protein